MKFTYQYKLSGGERHSGVCEAPSKDAVFAVLKKNGIKPYDVKLAPGILNRIRSYGKRGAAIVILLVISIVSSVVAVHSYDGGKSSADGNRFSSDIRRQILGDDAIIDLNVRRGWSDLFHDKGSQMLASCAIPGVLGGVLSCSEEELRAALYFDNVDLYAGIEDIESRQIIAIVDGMRKEGRQFLADGGSVAGYMRRMLARQKEERRYYELVEQEVASVAEAGDLQRLLEVWERCNDQLRNMGIKTVILPAVRKGSGQ